MTCLRGLNINTQARGPDPETPLCSHTDTNGPYVLHH